MVSTRRSSYPNAPQQQRRRTRTRIRKPTPDSPFLLLGGGVAAPRVTRQRLKTRGRTITPTPLGNRSTSSPNSPMAVDGGGTQSPVAVVPPTAAERRARQRAADRAKVKAEEAKKRARLAAIKLGVHRSNFARHLKTKRAEFGRVRRSSRPYDNAMLYDPTRHRGVAQVRGLQQAALNDFTWNYEGKSYREAPLPGGGKRQVQLGPPASEQTYRNRSVLNQLQPGIHAYGPSIVKGLPVELIGLMCRSWKDGRPDAELVGLGRRVFRALAPDSGARRRRGMAGSTLPVPRSLPRNRRDRSYGDASIGTSYSRSLLKAYRNKTPDKAFVVLAVDPARAQNLPGSVVGFVMCRVASSFAGLTKEDAGLEKLRKHYSPADFEYLVRRQGRWAQLNALQARYPGARKVVFIDLICGSATQYAGMTGRLLQFTLWYAKRVLGASIVVLEAVADAATFYAKFGFKRTPNACALKNKTQNALLARARAAYPSFAASYVRRIMNDPKADPSDAAALLQAYDGLFFDGFDDHVLDSTVVMSKCLG